MGLRVQNVNTAFYKFQNFPVKVILNLFNALVVPILTYGSEIWICDASKGQIIGSNWVPILDIIFLQFQIPGDPNINVFNGGFNFMSNNFS